MKTASDIFSWLFLNPASEIRRIQGPSVIMYLRPHLELLPAFLFSILLKKQTRWAVTAEMVGGL